MSDPNVLFKKFIDNKCSPEEVKQLMDLSHSDQQDELKALVMSEMERHEPESHDNQYSDLLDDCYSVIRTSIHKDLQVSKPLWQRLVAAASVIIGLTIGGYLILHKKPVQQLAKNQGHKIMPGGNRLILTLNNGKKVDLSAAKTGQVSIQGQAVVSKVSAGQIRYDVKNKDQETVEYNTVSAPRGGQGSIILADGTQVWLNASSSVTFPTVFRGSQRLVVVTGEAIFKVVANRRMPFRVIAKKQITEDIGTEFDINAYEDEPGIKTTLLEGSVKIVSGKYDVLLRPGQQSILLNNNLSVHKGDIQSAFAWRSGYLWFDNENIESIMRQLARWYNIEVSYEGSVSKEGFYGKISRFNNIQDVLNMLEMSKGVRFKIAGSKVIVLH